MGWEEEKKNSRNSDPGSHIHDTRHVLNSRLSSPLPTTYGSCLLHFYREEDFSSSFPRRIVDCLSLTILAYELVVFDCRRCSHTNSSLQCSFDVLQRVGRRAPVQTVYGTGTYFVRAWSVIHLTDTASFRISLLEYTSNSFPRHLYSADIHRSDQTLCMLTPFSHMYAC